MNADSRLPEKPGSKSALGRSPLPRRRLRPALAALVLVASVVVAVVALGGGGESDRPAGASVSGAPSAAAPADPALLALARRESGDPYAVGKPDAPVVLIEYSDFQCPFCGRFARETKPELLREYVEKGVLRIEWRHFPVFGAESEQAARASWAAGRQGRFWQFHDTAYAQPRERNKGDFADEALLEMAGEAGIEDLDRFRADMASPAADAAVTRDIEEGYALGVSSTPAFLVNDRPILGAQPTDVFAEAVEAAEAAAGARTGRQR
ncbi:thioredoxin domain-containing protein [Streptomyces sp. b94]|uniref:DsbA family protein n=1 Tax=Streptomyces sp. b94 TaxID=1827634 RepID=UPI001B365552|nr:thioredoxin domain-containing protein [Streptomyces sp. b94]MBQ1095260.1 thioredoxin domain-containing protein [Streptomyces sp. b94]